MGKTFSRELAEWRAKVDKQLSNLSSGNRLDHASLDGTTLWLKNGDEIGRLGRQPDGSVGVRVDRVKPPPQLTAPILTVGQQAGTCLVEWDGGTFDGRRMPLIHGHTEIWAELVGDEWEPTVAPSDAGKRVGTIRDRTGGEVVVALPQAGVWAVWLRAMGADRETAGPWSPVSTVEIQPLVDTEAIEQELEEARDRLEQAEQDLAAGMADRKAEIDYLREERIPALQDALNTGLDDVYREAQQYAEAQASDAVNQAAANAQSEYDRLQELAERALSRAGDNLIEDPSFETEHWVDEWNGLGGRLVRTSTAPVRTGDRLLVVEDGTPVDLSFPDIDVELDQSYRLTVWYRTWPSNLADLSDGESALVFYDSDTGTELARSEPLTVGSTYRRAEVVYQVPGNVQSIRPAIRASWPAGQMLFDDVSVREVGAAAEALRMAEVARQQAEAAHIAAGNAVDTAANAYDAASSKSTVHWSLSAPSGTADNTDDVWWQYELRDGKRVVTGQWFWDNGVWRETEIAEEWLPRVNIGTGTYGDLHGDRLTAGTVQAGALAVMPDGADFAPGPGGYEDLWTVGSNNAIVSSGSDPSGAQLRVSPSGSTASRTHGPWIRAQAGDTIYYRMYVGRTNSPDAALRIYFMYDGSYTSWDRVWQENASGWVEGVHTVPDHVESTVAFSLYAPGGSQGNYWIRHMEVRKQVKGVLIEPEGIKSPQVDTEEFFAAQAVIEKIWADIVRSRLIQSEGIITEDMIATGAITTPKLTVTEELVGELARFLKIEAGSLASNDIEAMRIVSSLIEATTYLIHDADGDVSVRLDGMDNYLAGRLQAGMNEGEGITLDWGEKVRYSGLTEEGDPDPVRTIMTPYLNFHTDDVDYETGREPSIHLDRGGTAGFNGMMIINPGYPVGTEPFRGTLDVVGDARANRVYARERATASQGFEVPHSDPNLASLLYRESSTGNTYLLGRHHGASQSRARDSFWVSDQYELAAGGLRRRVFTWGVPPPTGQRSPILSVRLTIAAADRNAWIVANSSHHSSTGYSINEYNPSSARATYFVYQLAVWEDV